MSRGSAWLYNYHALENSAVLWINMKGAPNLSLGFKDSNRVWQAQCAARQAGPQR